MRLRGCAGSPEPSLVSWLKFLSIHTICVAKLCITGMSLEELVNSWISDVHGKGKVNTCIW